MKFNKRKEEKFKEPELEKQKNSDDMEKEEKLSKVEEAIADLVVNHNHSWYREVFERNKNNLSDIAIYYRGNKITYRMMFEKVDAIARSLAKLGINEKSTIPACISNTPELLYIMLAASKVGAKLNIFGADFDPLYIKEIISGTGSDFIFISDDNYAQIKDILPETNIKKKVIYSLCDSLPNGIDPYYELDRPFYEFVDKVPSFIERDPKMVNLDKFMMYGEDYIQDTENPKNGFDVDFMITYTSGSTTSLRPKAIVHQNSSFIAMARFHDKDFSTPMKDVRSLASIPPYSNTDLITSISDLICQNCAVAFEPIYDKKFFLTSLLINKPNLVTATTSFWIHAAKEYVYNEKYQGVEMPWLNVPIAVGEAVSAGEEKIINIWLKKIKAKAYKIPKLMARLSMGGGDTEHGGLFFTLYKEIREKLDIKKRTVGLKPFKHVEAAVLRPDGRHADANELGRLVANSICTMREYVGNQEATKEFFIRDRDGKIWADLKIMGYIDERGYVFIKDRMNNVFKLPDGKTEIPLFSIAEVILEDNPYVMSCEVVFDEKGDLVAYIEFFPELYVKLPSNEDILRDVYFRVIRHLPLAVYDSLKYKVVSKDQSYPLTGCGKRSRLALENGKI